MVSKDSELKSHKKQQKEENSERFREIKVSCGKIR